MSSTSFEKYNRLKSQIKKKKSKERDFSILKILKYILFISFFYYISILSYIYFFDQNSSIDYGVINIDKKKFLQQERARILKIKKKDPSIIEDIIVLGINNLSPPITIDGGKVNNNYKLPGRLSYFISPYVSVQKFSNIIPMIFSTNNKGYIDDIYILFKKNPSSKVNQLNLIGGLVGQNWSGGRGLKFETFDEIESRILSSHDDSLDSNSVEKFYENYSDESVVNEDLSNQSEIFTILNKLKKDTGISLEDKDIISSPILKLYNNKNRNLKLSVFYGKKIAIFKPNNVGTFVNKSINLDINKFTVNAKNDIFLISIKDIVKNEDNFIINQDGRDFLISESLIEPIVLSIYNVVYADIKKKYGKSISHDNNFTVMNSSKIISDINNIYKYRKNFK